MTAKEITEKCYSPLMGKYVFDDEELQAYADALCKEQRLRCAEQTYPYSGTYIDKDWILNAPQPEAL